MNYATYAANANRENHTLSKGIELDANGNPINALNYWGNPWTEGAIKAARETRSYDVYVKMIEDLERLTGFEDTYIVNTYNKYRTLAARESNPAATLERLQNFYIENGKPGTSLIAYAATATTINEFDFVGFGWAEDEASGNIHTELANAAIMVTELMEKAGATAEEADRVFDLIMSAGATTISAPSELMRDRPEEEVKQDVPAPKAHLAQARLMQQQLPKAEPSRLHPFSGGWQVESNSSPGTFHEITFFVNVTGEVCYHCTCLGHHYYLSSRSSKRSDCWHMKEVAKIGPHDERVKTALENYGRDLDLTTAWLDDFEFNLPVGAW